MNHANDRERMLVADQVLDATTLTEVEAAIAALDDWIALHPDDQGMEYGYEQLALMKDGLQFEAERSAVPARLAKVS